MEQTLPPAASPPPARGFGLRSRLRAAGIHLGLSALVAAGAAALVFGLWYPTPFREISGGRELFFIVVAVDVVLGPLITFAVFDRRKPWGELRRDLAVVALLQLAGLAYGLHSVFIARPVVLVLEVYRLRVILPVDVTSEELTKAPVGMQSLPWRGVMVTAARTTADRDRLTSITQALAGKDVGMRPELWQDATATSQALAAAARPLTELERRYPTRVAELGTYVTATGRPPDRLGYLPLLARRTDWIALVDGSNGRIVGYAPFDGF